MKARHAALKHVGSSHQTPDDEGLDSDVTDFPGTCYKIGVSTVKDAAEFQISKLKFKLN